MPKDAGERMDAKQIVAPEGWSDRAVQMVGAKYLKRHPATGFQETSIPGMIDRVAKTIQQWAEPKLNPGEAELLANQVRDLCLKQQASFNSPVWFNIGVEGSAQQASACFILSVEDSMSSLQDLQRTEAFIYKSGSGAGVNMSQVRSSGEALSGGGVASGPVSFMRGFDAWAGVIKSGGSTRRAAKIVVLDVNHPDILEFVRCKAIAEKAAHALVAAGFSPSFNDPYGAYGLVPFQNANHTVRVTDAFMKAVEEGLTWDLKAVLSGEARETVEARDLFREIIEAAWVCGDPGLQFHDTANAWHSCPAAGPIRSTNPCGEFSYIDSSACNLASLNLLSFLQQDNTFDLTAFGQACATLIRAQDTLVDNAHYPTELITKNSREHRPLGLGYANLHALLMAMGLPYDSEEGRFMAAAVTSFMTASAFEQSIVLAQKLGPFAAYAANRDSMLKVVGKHAQQAHNLVQRMDNSSVVPKEAERIAQAASLIWAHVVDAGEKHGFRNAQVTLLAPTGTIAFMMDCDSTGIEPVPALVVTKTFVGGTDAGESLVARVPERALKTLGYGGATIKRILAHLADKGTIEDAPELKKKHLAVFDCALRAANGTRTISPSGHLSMMGAVQPFLSGAISKTVNLSNDATTEDIERIYQEAWKQGLRSITIYRDGCKASQPLTTGTKKPPVVKPTTPMGDCPPNRRHLPQERPSTTRKFTIAGIEGYATIGVFPDTGAMGEIFIVMGKGGSMIGGFADAWATAVSIGLQYGIPVDVFIDKFKGCRFDPAGFTSDDFQQARSIPDYIVRWAEQVKEQGTLTAPHAAPAKHPVAPAAKLPAPASFVAQADAPICSCGNPKVRDGACYTCLICGEGGGCGG